MVKAVGQPIERVDGQAKVTGDAKFAAEFRAPGLLRAMLVQSTIARGKVTAVDVAAARKLPGVVEIITSTNVPKLKLPEPGTQAHLAVENMMPLWDHTIHYAGQTVAVVVAHTLEQARHAASLLHVSYNAEKPVLDLAAAEPSASFPKEVHGQELQHKRGDIDAALAAPDIVKISHPYITPFETHNPMEMGATVAEWQGERLVVHDATRYMMGTRKALADVFGLPPDRVRVICPFVGGAFGSKNFRWSHTILAAVAARMTGQPVQLVLTRQQMFTTEGMRPSTVQQVTLAATRDGKLTAMRHETIQPTSIIGDHIEPCSLATRILYAVPNAYTPHKLVHMNIPTPTYMRAPGETPGTFAFESAMDELAHALKIDPLQLRLLNYAEVDPADGKPWSSKFLKECYARGAELFGWQRRTPEISSMKKGALLVGWGMATAIYPGRRWECSARIRLKANGTALVQSASHEIGTGAYTVFTQISADVLGLAPDQVTFELGDSDLPPAPGAGGSVSTASVSEAIIKAGDELGKKLAVIASADPHSPLSGLKPERIRGAEGYLSVIGDPRRVSYVDVLTSAGRDAVEAEAKAGGEDEKDKPVSSHSFGAQFCEVQIDPLLPRVQVTRWVGVFDNGRIINPRTARSQVLGGVTMGIGAALLEETVYDPRNGRPVTDNFADYHIPVNADTPDFQVEFIEHPDPHIGVMGARGVGELPITGVAAAVANAVFHATGTRIRDLPITPDKLL